MGWHLKTFQELTTEELYKILKERVEIFVVEQNCPYSEIDNNDQKAFHLYKEEGGEIIAYSRIFASGDYYKEASIGRVIVKEKYRKAGLGKELMKESLKFLRKELREKAVKIQAQDYLRKFYGSFGFELISEVYMMDNLPHVDMLISDLQNTQIEIIRS